MQSWTRRADPGRRPRPPYRAVVPAAALCLLLACYLTGLARHGDDFEVLVDGWLGSITTVLPALVVLVAGLTAPAVPAGRGASRRELLLLGAGGLSWSLGGLFFVVTTSRGVEVPFPSVGDAGFLGFPVLVFAAVLCRIKIGRAHV